MAKQVQPTFPEALIELLKSRKIRPPAGLRDAPPAAYAGQSAAFVGELAKLDDAVLADRAAHIAGYAKRQQARAKAAWDSSPVIREIKRRKLQAPQRPATAPAGTIAIRKPLAEWSDSELVKAAKQWAASAR